MMMGGRRRALIGGSKSQLVNSLAVGSLVRIANDALKDYQVAGESNYILVDKTYNGTSCCVLIRWKTVSSDGWGLMWNSPAVSGYSGRNIDNFCTSTMYNSLDTLSKSLLTNVAINVYNTSLVQTTLNRSIFVPSGKEYLDYAFALTGTAISHLVNESPKLTTWFRDEYSSSNAGICISGAFQWANKSTNRRVRPMIIFSNAAKCSLTANSDGSYSIIA